MQLHTLYTRQAPGRRRTGSAKFTDKEDKEKESERTRKKQKRNKTTSTTESACSAAHHPAGWSAEMSTRFQRLTSGTQSPRPVQDVSWTSPAPASQPRQKQHQRPPRLVSRFSPRRPSLEAPLSMSLERYQRPAPTLQHLLLIAYAVQHSVQIHLAPSPGQFIPRAPPTPQFPLAVLRRRPRRHTRRWWITETHASGHRRPPRPNLHPSQALIGQEDQHSWYLHQSPSLIFTHIPKSSRHPS